MLHLMEYFFIFSIFMGLSRANKDKTELSVVAKAANNLPSIDGVSTQKATRDDLSTYKVGQYVVNNLPTPELIDTNDPHVRVFVACIDGTENNKYTDPQHKTNVALIAEKLQGLHNPAIEADYQIGAGTQSNPVAAKMDAVNAMSMKQSIQDVYDRFCLKVTEWKNIDPNVKVVFVGVGFSNGAIQVQALSEKIHQLGSQDPNNAYTSYDRYEDVWSNSQFKVEVSTKYKGDPVLGPGSIPQALLLFEPVDTNSPLQLKYQAKSSVVTGLVLKARDDGRQFFDFVPVFKSDGRRFLVLTLAGAHSNIGGGYILDGLSTMSGNIGIDYLNNLFDRPILSSLPLPDDPDKYVIHHPEDFYWFYRIGLRPTRGINDKNVLDPEPEDENFLNKFKLRTAEEKSPDDVSEYRDPITGTLYYEVFNILDGGKTKETVSLTEDAIILSKTTTNLLNGNPTEIETMVNNLDDSYSITNVKFTSQGVIRNVINQKYDLLDNILASHSTILDGNNYLSSVPLTSDQFYIDPSVNDWAGVSKLTGISVNDLLKVNPQYNMLSNLLPGSVVNLPWVDNSYVPRINIEPDPQPQKQTKDPDQTTSEVQNGYAHKTPTSSILFSNSELDSSLFTDSQQAALVTGYIRQGSFQLDPNPKPSQWLTDNFDTSNEFMRAIAMSSLSAGGTKNIFIDPIALDLNGDGVHFTDYQSDGVLFDVDNSGMKSRTGWLSPLDGFLVLDSNCDFVISSICEMFSEYTDGVTGKDGQPGSRPYTSGWAALAKYDSNFDNLIDPRDTAIWNVLQVWIDSNHDGKSWIDTNKNGIYDLGEVSELKNLTQLGISSIDLKATSPGGELIRDGNRILSIGRYKKNATLWMEAVDVNFISDSTRHQMKQQESGTVIVSQFSGTLPGDNSISTVRTYFNGENTTNSSTSLNATQLGVNNVYGGLGDETLVANHNGSWLVGGGGSNTYKGGNGNDVFVISADDQQENIDGGAGINTAIFQGKRPVALNMAQANVHIAQSGTLNSVIFSGGRKGVYMKGGTGFSTLIGGSGNDVFVGGKGKNLIIGGRGQAIIHAGADDDIIYGAMNDSIIFLGGGWDQVYAGAGNDMIKLGTGNASIDGGNGTNIVELQGSYADYIIEKLTNASDWNEFEYRLTDRIDKRNGIALLKRIQKLTFNDISAVALDGVNAMPVPDVLHIDGCSQTTSGARVIVIPARQLLANDHLLNSLGGLRIKEVSDPIGGTVRLTNSNERIDLLDKPSVTTQQGDVLFECTSNRFTDLIKFKYNVIDAAGNPAITVEDLSTGATAPMRAAVYLVVINAAQLPDDPLLSQQNYLNDIHVYAVWNDGYTGKGVRIGQFEPGGPFSTGPEILNYTHPDLAPNIDPDWLKSELASLKRTTAFSDHATKVAGVMIAANNQMGMTGIAYGATIAGYYLSNNGQDLTALGHVSNFDVVNHSWDFEPDFALSNVQDGAVNTITGILANSEYAARNGRGGLGTVSVTAGGNSRAKGGSAQGSFANNNRFSIQVGAVNYVPDLSMLVANSRPFSNPGACLLVSAPGSQVLSTSQIVLNEQGGMHGNEYGKTQGTSFAAPIVSASVALMLEANPQLTYRDVQTILALSSHRIDDSNATWSFNFAANWNGAGMHVSHDYGFGHIDARAAVRLAETWLTNAAVDEEVVSIASSATALNVTAPIADSLNIIDNFNTEHVEVDVHLSFYRFGDVSVVLVSPQGTRSILLNRPGKIPSGFPGFDASDLGDQRTGELHYTFMSTFNWGEKSAGLWQLQIDDATPASTPVRLLKWTLRVYGQNTSADDTYVYTDEYPSLIGDSKRTLLTDSTGRNTLNAASVSGDVTVNILAGQASINGASLNIASESRIQNLISGDGNDVLVAGLEKSVLYAGRGFNTMTGSIKNDIFVVLAGKRRRQAGMDTIYGFSAEQGDLILIVGLKCRTFEDLNLTLVNSSDTQITLGSVVSHTILIKNTRVETFNAQNVIIQSRLNLPTSYLRGDSNSDGIAMDGTGVVKLNGSGFGVSLTFENGAMKWSLFGTIFKRDSKADFTRFVVLPMPTPGNYGNAVQGFIPKVDKIDLRPLGITSFSSLILVKHDRGVINGMASITGTDVKSQLAYDTPGSVTSLVYLDTLNPTQLSEQDFLFSTLTSPEPFNDTVTSCPNVCACQNNGVCHQADIESDTFNCTCLPGYNGEHCEHVVDVCTEMKPCQNGAVCSQIGVNNFTCSCANGTYGKRCEFQVDVCSNFSCLNNGVCVGVQLDRARCSCPYGYEGERCERVRSMCEPNNPCANNGTCSQTGVGSFTCTCPSGFNGTLCEKPSDMCAFLRPCLNNAVCTQIDTFTFNCTCPPNFNGTYCQQRLVSATTTIRSSTPRPTPTSTRNSTTSRISTTKRTTKKNTKTTKKLTTTTKKTTSTTTHKPTRVKTTTKKLKKTTKGNVTTTTFKTNHTTTQHKTTKLSTATTQTTSKSPQTTSINRSSSRPTDYQSSVSADKSSTTVLLSTTKRPNYCPTMWPQCSCAKATYLNCDNFTRFSELNFQRLDPSLLSFPDYQMFEIRIAPIRPLIFDSSFNATGLDMIKNTKSYYVIRIVNVIGFEVFANPFFPSVLYRTRDLLIENATLNFYLNGKLLAPSECTSKSFSLSPVQPLFKSFTDLYVSSVRYPDSGICPYLINDWSPSVEFFILADNYPKLMNINESTNDVMFNSVWLSTRSDTNVSIDLNMIDVRLIQNCSMLGLPSATYVKINGEFFKQFNYLNELYIQADNFGQMMRDTDTSWLSYLNYALKSENVNLNNASQVTSLLERHKYLLVNFPYEYTFPDEDFCLYKNFPHNQLVYVYYRPGSVCSCTVLYVLQNWLLMPSGFLANSYRAAMPCLNTPNITQTIQSCAFDARLSKC